MNKSKLQDQTTDSKDHLLGTLPENPNQPYQKLYRQGLEPHDLEEMKSNLVTYIELLIEMDKQIGAKDKEHRDIVESN